MSHKSLVKTETQVCTEPVLFPLSHSVFAFVTSVKIFVLLSLGLNYIFLSTLSSLTQSETLDAGTFPSKSLIYRTWYGSFLGFNESFNTAYV